MCDAGNTNRLEDAHFGLMVPDNKAKIRLMRGTYKYFHYMCDGIDDRGWGCGYRTLQTICSWILNQKSKSEAGSGNCEYEIPQVRDIQQCLADIGDKGPEFVGSKDWIGCVEAAYCIQKMYEVPCKIIHVKSAELEEKMEDLENHFTVYGSPIMMGGDKDSSAKVILGTCSSRKEQYLLSLDPHNVNINCTPESLQSQGWVRWIPISMFNTRSFYNMCCPLMIAK